MRPVNLIPPEDRRGERAPLRAGALSYVVIGACAAALVAVVALVLTQNTITDRENEIAQLEVEREAAAQEAKALAPYAQFATLQEQRELTIASLATSRFDWERVLRELALVIPADVSLTSLEASAAGESSGTAAPVATATATPSVPTLMMVGCAVDHEAVARLVAALEDIDGVTRVGLDSSVTSDTEGGDDGGGGGSASSGDCVGDRETATFSVKIVFDGATATPETAIAEATAQATATAPGSETDSLNGQIDDAQQAAELVPGVAR